jgi:organic hydroperoxide reductase OsmC/OhrA
MAEYTAAIAWNRNGAVFTDNRYSRRHTWSFDGGIELPASASPHVVPLPLSSPEAVDPEEAFVASLSSCHMLWFLSLAAKRGFVVERYRDDPIGTLSRDAEGELAMTDVLLRPRVEFGGETRPSGAELEALHHEAHDRCFLARSVKTEVRWETRAETP